MFINRVKNSHRALAFLVALAVVGCVLGYSADANAKAKGKNMERVQLQYLFKDKPYDASVSLANYDSLDFVSEGSHIYGMVHYPDGSFAEKRPCVILLHGIPGNARNDDLAHALCRVGCVVVVPHHRGAWGSEGKYLVTNCIQDAKNLVEWARSDEFVSKYHTDPDAVFLAGHSMGGCVTLNAGKTIPQLRGLILIAPYDTTRSLRDGKPEVLREVIADGYILHWDGEEAAYDDIAAHVDDWAFENAAEQVKDQNICVATGTLDGAAPGPLMVAPLWDRLAEYKTSALRRWKEFPAGHGLIGARVEFIRFVGEFIADSLKK